MCDIEVCINPVSVSSRTKLAVFLTLYALDVVAAGAGAYDLANVLPQVAHSASCEHPIALERLDMVTAHPAVDYAVLLSPLGDHLQRVDLKRPQALVKVWCVGREVAKEHRVVDIVVRAAKQGELREANLVVLGVGAVPADVVAVAEKLEFAVECALFGLPPDGSVRTRQAVVGRLGPRRV
jgi:hypothetical protein